MLQTLLRRKKQGEEMSDEQPPMLYLLNKFRNFHKASYNFFLTIIELRRKKKIQVHN